MDIIYRFRAANARDIFLLSALKGQDVILLQLMRLSSATAQLTIKIAN
jgi:hypothetical protein